MTDKFYLKEICGEYKFFEEGDSFPLTEKQILNKLNENEQLKTELKRCRNWINSDKDNYELTLAFIKNKGYSLEDVLEYEKELKDERI